MTPADESGFIPAEVCRAARIKAIGGRPIGEARKVISPGTARLAACVALTWAAGRVMTLGLWRHRRADVLEARARA